MENRKSKIRRNPRFQISNFDFRSAAGVSCLALIIGGCPKRQTVTRVVFTPPPPAAAAPAAETSAGTLVIEEPAPPEPPSESPQATAPPPAPKTAPRRHATEPETTVPQPGTEEPAPAEVPALQPHETSEQKSDLKRKVISLQQSIQQKMAVIEQEHSTIINSKAMTDARAFLNRSRMALQNGNLRVAMNLAQKASLLVDAAIQNP